MYTLWTYHVVIFITIISYFFTPPYTHNLHSSHISILISLKAATAEPCTSMINSRRVPSEMSRGVMLRPWNNYRRSPSSFCRKNIAGHSAKVHTSLIVRALRVGWWRLFGYHLGIGSRGGCTTAPPVSWDFLTSRTSGLFPCRYTVALQHSNPSTHCCQPCKDVGSFEKKFNTTKEYVFEHW